MASVGRFDIEIIAGGALEVRLRSLYDKFGLTFEADEDQSLVAEPDQVAVADAVEELPRRLGAPDRRFPFLDDMRGRGDGRRAG